MFHTEIDKAKNLLTVSYAQRVEGDDTKRAMAEIERLVVELQPGFRLLTDLSGLDSMDSACVPHIRKMMDLLNKKGVETVVRVIPDPHKDIGLNILSLFHYRRRVRIVTCETLDEAWQALVA